MKKKDSKRNGKGEFVSNTAHLILRLSTKLNAVQTKRTKADAELDEAVKTWHRLVAKHLASLLPDLKPRTIAQLKVKCPKFVTRPIQDAINEAFDVKVPFFTSLFGGSSEYKAQKAEDQHALILVNLRNWIEQQEKKPSFMADVSDLEKSMVGLRKRQHDLAGQVQALQSQIASLEQVHRTYSRSGAEPPAKLRSAVENGNRKLEELSDDRRRVRDDDFDVVRDVFIPQIIFDSVLHRSDSARDTHHHHGDDRPDSRSSSREDRGGGVEVDAGHRSRSDRGGGSEVSLEASGTSDRGGGMEVSMSRGDLS